MFLAPSGYETMFLSLAHTDDDIDRTDRTVAAAAARSSWHERRSTRATRRLESRRRRRGCADVVHEEQRRRRSRRPSRPAARTRGRPSRRPRRRRRRAAARRRVPRTSTSADRARTAGDERRRRSMLTTFVGDGVGTVADLRLAASRLGLVLVLLAPVQHEQAEDEQDATSMTKATNGGTRSDPRSRSSTTNPLILGSALPSGALRRRRRRAERTGVVRPPRRTGPPRTAGRVRELRTSRSCGLLPPISYVVEDLVLGDVAELGELGCRRASNSSTGGARPW